MCKKNIFDGIKKIFMIIGIAAMGTLTVLISIFINYKKKKPSNKELKDKYNEKSEISVDNDDIINRAKKYNSKKT